MESDVLWIILWSLILSLVLSPVFIYYSKRLQFSQNIRIDGPQSHLTKTGTPTMGGVIFVVAGFIPLLILERNLGVIFYLCLFVTLANALIGGLDDYGQIVKGASLGLKARSKIIGQIIITAIVVYYLNILGHPSTLEVPFTDISWELGIFYPVLVFLIISGTTNAVNLTDGLDGLATGSSIIALMAFLIIAAIQGSGDIVFFCGGLIGACFGFLVFNLHPAKVFMGDVGSLGLGAALAIAAILTKSELLLIIIGLVFVVETLSVIVQVVWFRLTGERLLLMSPFHHHLEIKGWSEWQVVIGFWALSFIAAIVGLWGASI